MRPIVSRVVDPPQYVSELIGTHNARWNSEVIEDVFLPYDASAIMQIPLCTCNIDDFWSWNFEKSGRLTLRLAYKMIVQTKKRREDWLEGRAGSSNTAASEKSWDTLWRLAQTFSTYSGCTKTREFV